MSRRPALHSFDLVEQRLRAREQLVSLSPGGSRAHPLHVKTSAVIEPRVKAMPCHHCGGEYRVLEHEMAASSVRRVDAECRHCSAPRTVWFRIVPADLN